MDRHTQAATQIHNHTLRQQQAAQVWALKTLDAQMNTHKITFKYIQTGNTRLRVSTRKVVDCGSFGFNQQSFLPPQSPLFWVLAGFVIKM